MNVLDQLDQELQRVITLTRRVKKGVLLDHEKLVGQITAMRAQLQALQESARGTIGFATQAHDAMQALLAGVDDADREVKDAASAVQRAAEQKTGDLKEDAVALAASLAALSDEVDDRGKALAPLSDALHQRHAGAIHRGRELGDQITEAQKRVTAAADAYIDECVASRAQLATATQETVRGAALLATQIHDHTEHPVRTGFSTLTGYLEQDLTPGVVADLTRFRDRAVAADETWQAAALAESIRFGEATSRRVSEAMAVVSSELPTAACAVFEKQAGPSVSSVKEASALMNAIATADYTQANELKRFMPAITAIHDGLQALNRL